LSHFGILLFSFALKCKSQEFSLFTACSKNLVF
jgi:hypothetical protein